MVQLAIADRDGRVRSDPRLEPLARSGWEDAPPSGLIPAPPGTTIAHLPQRFAVGRDRAGKRVSLEPAGGLAVAAILPPGYLRTWLPAYEEAPGAPVLPLYGYAAVAMAGGKPHVAAIRTDSWEAWDPAGPGRDRIGRYIGNARRALPGNRLIDHLDVCATDYRCLTAQNLFLRRGEGAIPVSPACNAACLGCISEQWGDVVSPQSRMPFAPTATEIATLAAWHLQRGSDNFVSFGQGCEGEPLTRGEALVSAVRMVRAAAPEATIHVNTNGSRPAVLSRLIDAGLNSARISIFSLDDVTFRAYYRPVGYGLGDIIACAGLLREAGAQLTINLLTFPGITDAPDEIDRLVAFVAEHRAHQVQLRSLNVDPGWLLARMPQRTRGIGMVAFVGQLEERCPGLRLGNFTRPWPARTAALARS